MFGNRWAYLLKHLDSGKRFGLSWGRISTVLIMFLFVLKKYGILWYFYPTSNLTPYVVGDNS